MPRSSGPTVRPLRPTLWDDLEDDAKNIFCTRRDLTNEASVEAFFVGRLLRELGYKDSQIETKKTLPYLTVGKGHKREKYRPDYALKVRKSVRCIIDANEWAVGAQHALYREDGTWYHNLTLFPGALFDAHGYLLFQTEQDYKRCRGAIFGKEKNWINVPTGISTLPGYVRVK